jgi:dissimilatory sulfite reductase (desulfoviridin) alpha/beta subunit
MPINKAQIAAFQTDRYKITDVSDDYGLGMYKLKGREGQGSIVIDTNDKDIEQIEELFRAIKK